MLEAREEAPLTPREPEGRKVTTCRIAAVCLTRQTVVSGVWSMTEHHTGIAPAPPAVDLANTILRVLLPQRKAGELT